MAIVTSDSDSVGTSSAGCGQPVSSATELSWQEAVKGAIRCPQALLRRLELPSPVTRSDESQTAHHQFCTFVPEPFLSRIRPGDFDDPLLRQVLPVAEETARTPGFDTDAVGDLAAVRGPGLIHKYQGRALLIANGVCAINCRYCFRRHFPYETAPKSPAQIRQALQVVAEDPSIHEIILSGGDPLLLTDPRLHQLVDWAEAIPHLRRLRVHSRLPVVIPQRITEPLIETLRTTRLTTVMVVHINHPHEIDSQVEQALARVVDAGILLLNQSVLLRGVNDDPPTLVKLSERLVGLRCMPYYLHQLDRVSGTAHFEVPIERGMELVRQMRNCLPGYAVPRYVCEIPGEPAKRVLA